MTALVKLLGGVRASVFAGLALVLAIVAVVQTLRVDSRGDTIDGLRAAAVNWKQANRDNVKAIESLRTANAAWAAAADNRTREAIEAVAAAQAERDRLRAELDSRRRERKGIYERDQDAAAWGRARVPDAVARQLRE